MKTLEFTQKVIGAISVISLVVWMFGQNPDITESAKALFFILILAYSIIQNVLYKQDLDNNEGKLSSYLMELKKANKLIEDWEGTYYKAEKICKEKSDKADYLQKKIRSLESEVYHKSKKLDESYAKNNDLHLELQTWKDLTEYAARIEFESVTMYAADRIKEMLESKFNNENNTDNEH